jgi:asparagine synthase (glutamine-hydrolysing)
MAHALEVREPLMDHPLVEWLSSLPPDLKLRHGEGKYLLKKSMEAYVPSEVLYRPKMGFAVPLASWFRGPLRERAQAALLGRRLAETGWFDPVALKRLLDAHQSGLRDYSAPIWSLLMLDGFLRNVADPSRASSEVKVAA